MPAIRTWFHSNQIRQACQSNPAPLGTAFPRAHLLPTLVGSLWASTLFLCMVRLWLTDLGHRARFEAADKVHKALDIAGYFLVVLAANNIRSVCRPE